MECHCRSAISRGSTLSLPEQEVMTNFGGVKLRYTMRCSPVGNQRLWDAPDYPKAPLAISGLCTSDTAAANYAASVSAKNSQPELRNAFNSDGGGMWRGVLNTLACAGFFAPKLFFPNADAILTDSYPCPFLLTQMLCMITEERDNARGTNRDGQSVSKISGVSRALDVENSSLRRQIEQSLSSWVHRLMACLEPNATLLIMGATSGPQLMRKMHVLDGEVSEKPCVRVHTDQGQPLLQWLETRYAVRFILHPASFGYSLKKLKEGARDVWPIANRALLGHARRYGYAGRVSEIADEMPQSLPALPPMRPAHRGNAGMSITDAILEILRNNPQGLTTPQLITYPPLVELLAHIPNERDRVKAVSANCTSMYPDTLRRDESQGKPYKYMLPVKMQ